MNPPANSNDQGGGHTFHPGAIQVHAPGATVDDARAIAQEVATQVSNQHWQQRGPALAGHAKNEALKANVDLMLRGGRYARGVRGS